MCQWITVSDSERVLYRKGPSERGVRFRAVGRAVTGAELSGTHLAIDMCRNGGRKTTITTLPSPSVSLQANSHSQRSASTSSRKETFSAPARSQTFAIVPYSEDPLETVDQTASTCRVETLDGYPTLEVFKIYMQAYFAETLWTSVKNHLNGGQWTLEAVCLIIRLM
jgi:hypothetical protein